MFKRFQPGEAVTGVSNLKSSAQRAICNDLVNLYAPLGEGDLIKKLLPTKKSGHEKVFSVKCKDHVQMLALGEDHKLPLFFKTRDGVWYPTLRLVHRLRLAGGDGACFMPRVQVDRGAIPYILGGANVMCPGLTGDGADMPEDLAAGTPVCIFAEGKKLPLAVGVLKMSTADIAGKNKGIGIEVVHHLDDGLWRTTTLVV